MSKPIWYSEIKASNEIFQTFFDEQVGRFKSYGIPAAEDAVGEAITSLEEKEKNTGQPMLYDEACAWLYTTTKHILNREYRLHKNITGIPLLIDNIPDDESETICRTDPVIDNTVLTLMEILIAESPLQRKAVLRARLAGKTYLEIAENMGITTSTVRNHIYHFKIEFRSYLIQQSISSNLKQTPMYDDKKGRTESILPHRQILVRSFNRKRKNRT